MTQTEMLLPPPRAHRRDPGSSHEAADAARAFAATHAGVVLAAVRCWPLSTSAELAQHVPYDLTETRRRLDDLFLAGRVRKFNSPTPCEVSGKRVLRWEAAP